MPDHMKDDNYREKRKRNNDSARRSREKRKMNDMAMEQKLLELTKENDLLKSKLNSLESSDSSKLLEIKPSNSVIVAGPSVSNGDLPTTTADQINPYRTDSLFGFPSIASGPNNDIFYPLDLSQAAMAAAAAAFKFPQGSTGAFLNPHLLAAAAAAATNSSPLIPPVIPGFGILPTPGMRPFPSNIPSNTSSFSSSRSAFQPFSSSSEKPPLIDLIPAPPRPSATSLLPENRPTSVIHCTPIVNGRGPSTENPVSRPSVVQPPMSSNLLGASQSSLSSNPLGSHIQFISQLPLAQEPRPSIFSRAIPSDPPQTRPPIVQPPPTQQSILGSLLSANRRSPTVPESRTVQQSGLANDKIDGDFKTNLSTLAVHLHSNSSASSTSSNNTEPKSDSDSLSPHSTHSTRSGSDEHSQNSPRNHDQLTAESSSSKADSGVVVPDLERYRDRRRRNNEAAKRCRANRRAAFEYRSKRSQQLEVENGELRQEMLKLNNELEQLKAIITANNRLLPTQ